MMINKSSIIFSLKIIILFSSSSAIATPDHNQRKQLAPALYVFGDSLLDSGNNNFLQTIIKADYLPYGVDFVNHTTTGRFTNGKTAADFIAEFLGVPYPPPFLSFNINDSLPLTGLNYASGACGILPETGRQFGKCLNMEEQVGLFRDTVTSLQQQEEYSSKEISEYLSKSIFIVSIGSNDYINNEIVASSSVHDSSKPHARKLTQRLSHHLRLLYTLGARKLIVFEIGPIGCVPAITRTNKHNGQPCVEDKNKLVSEFNTLIPGMLQDLTSSLKGSIFVLGRAYGLAYDAIINPSSYGLVDVTEACCLTLESGVLPFGCIPTTAPCSSRDEYYFWDGYHPSQAVFSLLASRCINDPSFCTPFTLTDLVQL